MKYRIFDRSTRDVRDFCPVFWEYWLKVNGEDLSDEVEELVLGVPVKITRIERAVYGYLADGFTILLVTDVVPDGAVDVEKIVGFAILRRVCDVVLDVRHMFLEPEYRDTGAGVKLIRMVDELSPVHRIIFQTRLEAPPELFLGQTKRFRRLIAESDRLATWEMDWGSNGRQE